MPATSRLVPFKPFEWASRISKFAPSARINGLYSGGPTPIQPWTPPGSAFDGIDLCIKRDDLTGSELGGNKVRKLEFILGDAVAKGCDTVLTCGGVQSNHCRATALAARRLGLDCELLLRSPSPDPDSVEVSGNLLLNVLAGAQCHLVPGNAPWRTGLKPRMQRLAADLEAKGKRPYSVPVGGSDMVGLWGYLDGFDELLQQGLADRFDDVVVATGSGGTACGLAISNWLCGAPVRVHAVSVCDSGAYFHRHINDALTELEIDEVKSEGILNIIDGFKGRGYGLTSPSELETIVEVSQTTGVLLDPVYTGKAFHGLRSLCAGVTEAELKGSRVLFIHTGGIFGMLDGGLSEAGRAARLVEGSEYWNLPERRGA